MLDESINLTVTKQLLITVKYYHISTKATLNRILELSPIRDGLPKTMVGAVWNLFQEYDLDLNYCYGIGAGGKRVNQGQKKGFYQVIPFKTLTYLSKERPC